MHKILLLLTTLADYGLDGTVEGTSAQPYDLDLVAISRFDHYWYDF